MTLPIPAQNPILAELSNLSPGAKTALLNAHAASSTPVATEPSPQSSTLLSPQPQPTPPKLQAPSANSSPAQIGATAPQRTLSTQSAPAAPPMQAPKITPQSAEAAPKLLSTPMAKPAMPNLEAPARPAIHIGPPVAGAPSTIGPAPDPSMLAGVSMPNSGSTHPNLEPPPSSTIITGPKRGEEMYSNGEPIRPGTLLGDKIELERAKENGPGEEQLYHKITGSHFGQEHPFLAKVLGGAAAGLTGVADIGLTTLGGGFGRLAAEMTPGSILNHELDLSRKSRGIAEEEANQQKEAQTGEENAEADNARSEINLREHPHPTYQSLPTDDGIFAFNPTTGTAAPVTGPNGESLSKPEKVEPHYVTQDDGSIVAITTDKAGKPSAQVVYKGNPKQETQIVPLEVNGVEHSVIVDKRTGAQLKDLGPSGNKPPSVSVSTGTFSLGEVPDGKGGTKSVLWNTKTGKVEDAPEGLAKPGTAAKASAALQPVQAAIDYANDYVKNGVYTGSGDEALMEKYFELAKPSTGFRMTQPQIDMEMKGRSWMNSLEAHARHATVGTWFSDDQRKQIVDTMQSLYNAKVKAAQSGGENNAAGEIALGQPVGMDKQAPPIV